MKGSTRKKETRRRAPQVHGRLCALAPLHGPLTGAVTPPLVADQVGNCNVACGAHINDGRNACQIACGASWARFSIPAYIHLSSHAKNASERLSAIRRFLPGPVCATGDCICAWSQLASRPPNDCTGVLALHHTRRTTFLYDVPLNHTRTVTLVIIHVDQYGLL